MRLVKWALNHCFGFEICEEPDYSRDVCLSVCLCEVLFDYRPLLKVNSCLKLWGLNVAGFVPVACAVEPDR